jgi:hypothetical protein
VNLFFSRQYRLKKGLLRVKIIRRKRLQSLPGEGALGKGAKRMRAIQKDRCGDRQDNG